MYLFPVLVINLISRFLFSNLLCATAKGNSIDNFNDKNLALISEFCEL